MLTLCVERALTSCFATPLSTPPCAPDFLCTRVPASLLQPDGVAADRQQPTYLSQRTCSFNHILLIQFCTVGSNSGGTPGGFSHPAGPSHSAAPMALDSESSPANSRHQPPTITPFTTLRQHRFNEPSFECLGCSADWGAGPSCI